MEAEIEQPTIETIKVTCRSKREFENLFGDGREVVDITLDKERPNEFLAHYYKPLGIAHSKEKQVLGARELWRKIV